MKFSLTSKKAFGFSSIELGLINNKKPYIVLEIAESKKPYHDKLLRQIICLDKEKVACSTQNGTTKITISGKNALIQTLTYLLRSGHYPEEKNQACFDAVKQFCRTAIFASPQLAHSKKSKLLSKYENTDQKTPKFANLTKKAIKITKQTSAFFHKHYIYPRKNCEVEALASAYYRLLMGYDRAAIVKSVYDQNNHRAGTISKEIPGFTPGGCTLLTEQDEQKAINAGVVEMLVASYVLEENDLHTENWGFNKDGKAVRVDFDRSFWSRVAKYFMVPKNPLHGFTAEKSFKITARDLLQFPKLEDARIDNWWIEGEDLHTNPAFREKKWLYFLKALLLQNQSVITHIAQTYLGSEKYQNEYASHLNTRLGKLKNILLAIPEFQDYLAEHPKAIETIINEFSEYNKNIKDKNSCLRVDLASIKNAYQGVIDQVKITDPYKNQLQYQLYKKRLIEKIKSKGEETKLCKKADAVLKAAETINYRKENIAEIGLLAKAMQQTTDLMDIAPYQLQDEEIKNQFANYNRLANEINGKRSNAWKILGAAMVALGSILCVGGIAISHFILATVGAGVCAKGFGLFTRGPQKEVVKRMAELEKYIQYKPI